MPESQGGSVPTTLPDLKLVHRFGDGIRGLDTVRIRWIMNRKLYRLGLSRDRRGSQWRAHGPPLIFLQVVTSIPDSPRVRSPTSSCMHDSTLPYSWMRGQNLVGQESRGPPSQGGEAGHGLSG